MFPNKLTTKILNTLPVFYVNLVARKFCKFFRERSSRPSRMHHRKGKNGSSGNAAVGKSIGRRESGMEAMTKLR